MSKRLRKEQISQLRGSCHQLQPVVMIAGDGFTENICAAIEAALLSHELIKIRIRADREQRDAISASIISNTGAEQVMRIGQVLCIYRRHPDNPQIFK